MGTKRKTIPAIIAIILAVMSITVGHCTSAQTLPKPSVPEFTVKYVDNSYDEPPVYGVDPYTGKTVLTQAGYHVQSKTLEVAIKNQPYHSYRNENGSLVWLYYVVEVKGHFEQWVNNEDWTNKLMNTKIYDSHPYAFYSSDESEYTLVAYALAGNTGSESVYTYSIPPYRTLDNISDGGEVDFRVQAVIGYSTRINETFYPGPPIGLEPGETYHYYIFTGQTSDWSGLQTIKISDESVQKTQPTQPAQTMTGQITPTQTTTSLDANTSWETVPLNLFITGIAALTVVIVALALLLVKKSKRGTPIVQNQ